MEIDLIFKIAAVGIVVSILNQVLVRSGREEQATMTSLAALGVYCMSQQVYMPYLIIYIQRFLGITDYTLLLAGVLIVSSVLSVLAGRPIDRFGKLRCLVPAGMILL